MECIKLLEKSTNRIRTYLAGEDGKPVTDATVELTMVDQNQEPVGGWSYPQTMANQGDGLYEVISPATLEAIRSQNYQCQISSSSPTQGSHYQEVLAICVVNRR